VTRALALALLLAGCAAPGLAPPAAAPIERAGAAPRQAILYRDTVTVQFSDGALCVAPRPSGARAWSGQLAGCAHLAPYQVTLPPGPQVPRRVLVRLSGGGTAVLTLQEAQFGVPGPA